MLAPPQSPEELAQAIVTLAGDWGLQQRPGARAACDGRECFSIDRAVTQLEDLYESVMAGDALREPVGARR